MVATHVVARARHRATGRFGLRITPGGFGTPEFGDGNERVRVASTMLIHELGPPDGASTHSIELDGAALADLAAFLDLDLSAELSVGHDTPALGDVTAPLSIDAAAASYLATWFDLVARALDRVVAGAPATASPSMVQLWPEHFDVAVDLAVDPSVDPAVDPATGPAPQRVNLGGSPGDGFHEQPYLYVGPWEPAPWPVRGGAEPGYWNAPFGAVMSAAEVFAASDPVSAAVTFFRTGLDHLNPGTVCLE